MDYEVYHDESQVGAFWHGILLVPTLKKKLLVDQLSLARANTNYHAPLGIKKVREGKVYLCSQAWLTIALASLRSTSKNRIFPYFLGTRISGRKEYPFAPLNLTGVKFILFCERDSFTTMAGHRDHASKFETTFRMGFKGGLHFLGSPESPITIRRIHFDGFEHHKRHLDHDRIVTRLASLRDYCEIDKREDLIDDRTGNHQKNSCQDYEDCQLLQLTDLLIGSFRSLLRPTNPLQTKLSAHTIKGLVDKYFEGYARMRNSRWFNSFCMSQCYLDSGSWKFDTLDYSFEEQNLQLHLPWVIA